MLLNKQDHITQVEPVIDDGWEVVRWRDVQVGDFVKVTNRSFIPADMLVVTTSEPLGMCYIETSNLDGETNLKIHQAHPELAELGTPHHTPLFSSKIYFLCLLYVYTFAKL